MDRSVGLVNWIELSAFCVWTAVAYDPKVVTIWEGIREHFRNQAVPMVDRNFHAKIVVRRDAGIRTLSDLAGKTLAVGSRDSAQARIPPLYLLKRAGVDLRRVQVLPFDTDVGKHGDTGTSELEVLAALGDGRAAAGAVGELIWTNEQMAERIDPGQIEVLWTTPPFDHCMFDGTPGLSSEKIERFQRVLFAMHWDDPQRRRILEIEGLKQWLPPHEEGYTSLHAALDDKELAF